MKRLFLLMFLWCAAASLLAQKPVTAPVPPTRDTTRIVTIENADRLTLKKVDTSNELTIGVGNVFFRDGKTKFYCDSAIKNKKLNIIEAFGNVHINDADSTNTYSQYLIYHIDKKTATLQKKVRLTDSKSVLTTDNLDYDTKLRIGVYRSGGKIVSDKTTITSQDATYYADLKDVYFKNKVKLQNPADTVITDSLLYNTNTRIATFITDTYIKDSSGMVIQTPNGYYDLQHKISKLGNRSDTRSIVKDHALTITGDSLAMDDSTGMFQGIGNAIMIDTSQGVTVIANNIKANRSNSNFLATQHPLMILKQDRDSIYVTGDTLYSGRMKDSATNDTTKRYFMGFHHIRIFSDSLQAVSDSLYYSSIDSVFQLFYDPIVWANKSQVTGDTIYMYTKNKKPEHLYVFENAMMINQADTTGLFNQLKGRTLDAYFKGGDIDHVQANGSPAESVYYIQDEDSAFVSMNWGTARTIDIYFEAKELHKVVYRMDPVGTNYPMRQIPEEKKKLKDFHWLEDKRPKTKYELFEDVQPPPQPAQNLPTILVYK